MTTRPVRFLAARRTRLADDSGVSLIFALIFITVVAVITGAVLTLIDANLRTTTAMREQAAEAAVADGAAQIAINQLRTSSYLGGTGDCFGVGNPTLSPEKVYSGTPGSSATTMVTCDTDTKKTDLAPINTANRPRTALLTLQPPGSGVGIDIGVQGKGNDKDVIVDGGAFSNSRIATSHGRLVADWSVARSASCPSTSTVPNLTCPYATSDLKGENPGYKQPDPPTDKRNAPTCPSTAPTAPIQLQPGLYTDAVALSALTATAANCSAATFWFQPGVYYFDFSAADDSKNVWTIDQGYVVGGGKSSPGQRPAMPGACRSPLSTTGGVGSDEGVTFVLAGSSQVKISEGAKVEICGIYSETSAPLAIFELTANIPATSTMPTVKAHVTCASGADHCAAIVSESDNSPYDVYIQGVTYLPKTAVEINLKKSDKTVSFKGGIVAYQFSIGGQGNTSAPITAVELPDFSTTQANRTVLWLNVYVCPGGGSCDDRTGKLRLRVKVSIVDGSGEVKPGQRQITVLSWGVQR
jgi:hypothetical protein